MVSQEETVIKLLLHLLILLLYRLFNGKIKSSIVQFEGQKSWCSIVNVKDKWRVSLGGQQNQLLKKGKCLKGNSKPIGFFCKNTKSRPNMLMSQ
jgi:hypothetical protein